jgi:hypothetical protein
MTADFELNLPRLMISGKPIAPASRVNMASGRFSWQRGGAHGRPSLAKTNGGAGWRDKGRVSVRHSGIGREVQSLGNSLATVIRQQLGSRVHFRLLGGWEIPTRRSAVAEVYPALWNRSFPRGDRTNDQHDAFSVAAWLSRADTDGTLATFFAATPIASSYLITKCLVWPITTSAIISSNLLTARMQMGIVSCF